ncbi:unnamed protein product [Pelagomonas calceolata]|uniref:Major facilitator superfamily associated domain-containing protein n=2 Tax=Pelagomonas calceolata TaxID=35677 RepID=A0A8J2SRW3_9STRA|nr:unnamed protein product [Pelagomonas calceolata]
MERPAAPVEMPGMRLPRGLLALYTLGALEAAVPLVAQVQWLDAHGVGQAQQLRVFALGYACFSLRPVYGALADALATRYGARGRVLAYVAASFGGVLCHCTLAVTRSVASFAVGYALLCACQACAETCLGARLADVVASGVGAGRAQAEATAARWLGTLLASCVGFAMYRCDHAIPSPATAFLAAAACPLVGVVVALTASDTTPISMKRDAQSPVPLLIAVQVACAWVSAKGALATTIWCVSGAGLAVVFIAVLCYRRKTTALEEPLLAAEKPGLWRAGPFLVAVAAAPSASEVLANVRYERFQGRPCVLPLVNAGGALAAMIVCLVCVRRPPATRKAAAVAVFVAAGARLAQLPAARNVVYATLGNVVDSAGGALLGVAATTFALKAAAGSERRGAVYGAYLAAYDSGGAASGWLAVFLATKCRTEPDHPASVRRYLYVAAAASLIPLAFLPLVPVPEPPREESSDESSDDDVSLVL